MSTSSDCMDEYNVTSGNSSSYNNAYRTRDEDLAQLEIALMGVCFGVAFVGNMAVLIVLLLRRQKITRMYYFILHLSLADLSVAFLNVLPQMIWDITWRFKGNDFLCKTVKFCQVFSIYLSAWILVMMCYDRMMAICYPLNSYSWRGRRCQVMILTAWIISILCSLPQIFVFSQQQILPGVFDCWASFIEPWGSKMYVAWFAFSIYLFPLILQIFSYSKVIQTVWKVIRLKENGALKIKPGGKASVVQRSRNSLSRKSTVSQSSLPILNARSSVGRTTHSTYRRVYNRTKLLTVKLTAVVIVCYIVCWSPFIFALLWTTFFPELSNLTSSSEKLFAILLLLANLNSCTNPWIYLFFSLRKYVRCQANWSRLSRRGAGTPGRSAGSTFSHNSEVQEEEGGAEETRPHRPHYHTMNPFQRRKDIFGISLAIVNSREDVNAVVRL
ncbi:oxytocin receptor-like [Paramacrobiotus metropolitanus]|uniref:oxytocin receptor-like n=1 Tax=Paramacrobiotus metropolitanus TaxID=2943436 RepID=UPI002445FCA5|nr:oxytocin receptor-like [Paramacrobiotus metropolitanus]